MTKLKELYRRVAIYIPLVVFTLVMLVTLWWCVVPNGNPRYTLETRSLMFWYTIISIGILTIIFSFITKFFNEE